MEEQQLDQQYDAMWSSSMAAFSENAFRVDKHLQDKAADMRRSVTLILRLNSEIKSNIADMMAHLQQSYPGQYFYHPGELHITVLSMFTATTDFLEKYQNLTWYQHAIQTVLERTDSFHIHFQGITASPGALMIQGFPEAHSLNRLRDRLRASLKKHGVGGDLDQRYAITTAHVTFMRFRSLPADGKQFNRDISDYRNQDFGQMLVKELELVKNDWYLSREKTRTIRLYELQNAR